MVTAKGIQDYSVIGKEAVRRMGHDSWELTCKAHLHMHAEGSTLKRRTALRLQNLAAWPKPSSSTPHITA